MTDGKDNSNNNNSIYTIPERWARAWCNDDPEPWVSLYSPSARYIDHAFQIDRSGHDLLTKHFSIWRHANPDFIMTIIDDGPPNMAIWWRGVDETRGDGECSFRTLNRGTSVNDLPVQKANGKEFVFRGAVDMVIRKGKIERLEEYYTNTPFSEGVEVEEYRGVRGSSF